MIIMDYKEFLYPYQSKPSCNGEEYKPYRMLQNLNQAGIFVKRMIITHFLPRKLTVDELFKKNKNTLARERVCPKDAPKFFLGNNSPTVFMALYVFAVGFMGS
jgi:hypothetical protein